MALAQFLAALAAAGELDAATQPVIRPKVRNTGLVMLLGGAIAITASYITETFNCATLLSVLVLAVGILVLLKYALEAKRYGSIAVVLILAFAATGLGAVLYLRREARWTPTALVVTRDSRLTSVATSESVRPTISLPEKINVHDVSATSVNDVRKRYKPLIPQVYIDNSTGLMYLEHCRSRPSLAVHAPRSVAVAQGFRLAPGCTEEPGGLR